VVLLARVLGIDGSSGAPNFADSSTIPPFARADVAAMASFGIINGRPGNIFDPFADITRAETVHILNNAITDVLSSSKSDFSANFEVVNAPNLAVANANIADNLILSEGVGVGSTYLQSVDVSKDLIVRGGNVNLASSNAQNMVIDDKVNNSQVQISPDCVVKNIEIDTPCHIVNYGEVDGISVMCDGVTIESATPISISGDYKPNLIDISGTTPPPTVTPWGTPLPSATPNTYQSTPLPSATPFSAEFSPTPSPNSDLVPAAVPSATPSPTATPNTHQETELPYPTLSHNPSASPSPTYTPTGMPNPSPTRSPSPSPTISPSPSPSPSPTQSPSSGKPQYISLITDNDGKIETGYSYGIVMPFVFGNDESNIDAKIEWVIYGVSKFSDWLSAGNIPYVSGERVVFENDNGDPIDNSFTIVRYYFKFRDAPDDDAHVLVYPSN